MAFLRNLAVVLLLAGVSFAAQAQFTPPPCSVTASPSSPQVGATVTLTASCTPAATLYVWSANTGTSSTAATIQVTIIQTTTTFSVVASNGSGTIGSASISIIASASGVPQCSLLAQPATIAAGGTSALLAVCSPAATSYTWTNTNITGSSGNVSPTVTTVYSVRGSNASGAGNTASATVTVTGAGSTPQCSLTASPSTIIAGGTSRLTATCNPAATSYTWTNATFGPATSSGDVSPAATTTYSVRGSNNVGAGNTTSTRIYRRPDSNRSSAPCPFGVTRIARDLLAQADKPDGE